MNCVVELGSSGMIYIQSFINWHYVPYFCCLYATSVNILSSPKNTSTILSAGRVMGTVFWLISCPQRKLSVQFATFKAPETAIHTLWHAHEKTNHSSTWQCMPSHRTPDFRENWNVWLGCALPSPLHSGLGSFGLQPVQALKRSREGPTQREWWGKSCVHDCKMLKQAYTAVEHLRWCSAGKKCPNHPWILWNSDRISPVTQDGTFLYM